MKDTVIKVSEINKYFPGVHALKNVEFELERGEVHALLGENGAGKSTLIKILGGMYRPESGEIFMEGQKKYFANPKQAIEDGISIIYQELNLSLNLSIAENIYFGRLPLNKLGFVDRRGMNAAAKKMLKKVGLNVSPNAKVKYLSTAQQQLLEIAKALSANAKVIIMDEPTSALSPKEIDVLFGIIRELQSNDISIIYVSHKLEELYAVCDRVTIFRDGRTIETLSVADTSTEGLIKSMVGRKLDSNYTREAAGTDETVLDCQNICTNKIKNISLRIHKGEIIGFSGLMGAGKTEIAKALFGIDKITSGEILLDGSRIKNISPEKCAEMGIGYVPEDRKLSGLFLNLSVKHNVSISTIMQFTNKKIVNRALEKKKIDDEIKILSIKTPSQLQKVCNLSGGNQQKCILARWLLHNNLKVLIIDEPTRGIDVGAKQEIYTILNDLAKRGIAIVIMSSEMPELVAMSDRIVVMKQGRMSAILEKNEITQEKIMQNAVI